MKQIFGVLAFGLSFFPGRAEEPVSLIEPVYISESYSAASALSFPRFENLRWHKRPDTRLLFELPADPMFSQQWYFHNAGLADETGTNGTVGADIGLYAALQVFEPRETVILAVIDSGLDLLHEDMDPEVLWTNPGEIPGNGFDDDGNGYIDDVHGINLAHKEHNIQDRHYHGTHITGLLAAQSNNQTGIAGGFGFLKIMPIVIFGLGQTATRDQIAQGIRYACDHGAKVINASWGGKYFNQNLGDAILYCDQKGVLFVNAAGNSREDSDITTGYPTDYGHRNQVIVGASDNRDRSALFSNYGKKVDLAAPGNVIFSLMPKSRYRAMSGTSQAAPMVAASLAMLYSRYPDMNHMEAKARLLRTADRFQALRRFTRDGARLNVYNLLTNQAGIQIEDPKGEFRKVRDLDWQSTHPYRTHDTANHEITVPGACFVRLHFKKFELDHFGDFLEITAKNGRVVERLNGEMLGEDFYSEPVAGDTVRVQFLADKSLNRWGYHIDSVEAVY